MWRSGELMIQTPAPTRNVFGYQVELHLHDMEYNLMLIKKEKCQVHFRNLTSLLFIIKIKMDFF